MKRFKDLNETDVIYILTECNDLYICKVVRIYRGYGSFARFIYDYVDKYTSRVTERHVDVNLEMCGDMTDIAVYNEIYPYSIYLNIEDVIIEIDHQIERLNNHKKTLKELF